MRSSHNFGFRLINTSFKYETHSMSHINNSEVCTKRDNTSTPPDKRLKDAL
jgi:hypothetical protein